MKRALWLTVVVMATATPTFSATQYTNDGSPNATAEAIRWLINRARYAPEIESDRYNLTNSSTAGHPDFDCCEDTQGTNDFGTNTTVWLLWRASKPPLAFNARLLTATQKHSQDMAETGQFSHYSPSSNYYGTNSSPSQRGTAEGYAWNAYGENIACGTDWWLTPERAHSNLFVDATIANRGHRKIIMDYSANYRELGVGYQTATGTAFYTEDFGRSGTITNFFTDTIFHDANTNRMYDTNEGIANVEIQLWLGTSQSAWYDVSGTSGGFALPINDIPDGSDVTVQLCNLNPTSIYVTLPFTYSNQGTIVIAALQTNSLGILKQPYGETNAGFRNMKPAFTLSSISLQTNTASLLCQGYSGTWLTLEKTTSLLTPSWSNVISFTTTSTTHSITDSSPLETNVFYRVRVKDEPL